jgi:hypothetical protein
VQRGGWRFWHHILNSRMFWVCCWSCETKHVIASLRSRFVVRFVCYFFNLRVCVCFGCCAFVYLIYVFSERRTLVWGGCRDALSDRLTSCWFARVTWFRVVILKVSIDHYDVWEDFADSCIWIL